MSVSQLSYNSLIISLGSLRTIGLPLQHLVPSHGSHNQLVLFTRGVLPSFSVSYPLVEKDV
jgi:hypothetical protein